MNIAIAGAGPAGLVAGIAARRAGFTCSVYEQAPSFRPIGGGVGIQTNGRIVLAALGLAETFAPFIEITYEAGVEAPPGRTVSRTDFREVDHPIRGFAVALRYDLQEVLLKAAIDSGVEVHFDRKCVSARTVAEHAEVSFADGAIERADVLLACDGVNSLIRNSLPFKSRLRNIPEAYLRVVVPIAHPEPERIGEYWADDARRVGAFPLPGNRTYVFCSVPLGRWRDIIENDLETWVRSWNDFGSPVSTLMNAVTDWSTAVYDELSDLRVDKWSDGRVFLVGDAVHAMTPNLGQGANSAMVDSLVLVNMLAQSGGDIANVRKEYERVRKLFVTRIQDAALFVGDAGSWRSAPARALRDFVFATSTKVGPLRRRSMVFLSGLNAREQRWLV